MRTMSKVVASACAVATSALLFSSPTFAAMNCSSLPTWNANDAYTGGTQVQYQGNAYQAAWWTQGANPAENSGEWQEWKFVDSCSNSSSSSSSGGGGSSSSSSSGSSSSGGNGSIATVYQHCNYTGWAASIGTGSHTLGSLQGAGFVNDDASSISIAAGYEAVLYEHDNFGGASVVISGDDNCLVNEGFNDFVSSIKIQPSGTSSSSSSSGGTSSSSSSSSGGGTGNKKVIGYFAQWGVYGRDYHVKNLHTSGSADKITHILYAFGNVTNGQCQIGDAYADYDKFYDASASVDGQADSWDTGALRGSFNQLRKLKQMYPHIKVIWSFGGWTWSGGFGQASQNASAFADSCYNLVNDARWADVFDGIDIDWEYPNACGLSCDSSGFGAYKTLMQALRARFGNQLVTSAIGAGEAKLNAADYAGAAQYLDWYMPMTYDFFGGWDAAGPTAPHSALYNYNGIPVQGFYSDNAIQVMKAKGIPAHKILLGIGFYGRGWTGVSQKAPGGSAAGAAQGVEPGVQDYKVLKNECPSNGTIAGTAYAHCGNNWWSYDTPATIKGKMDYVNQQGLSGAFFWEFSGDTSNGELVKAIADNL